MDGVVSMSFLAITVLLSVTFILAFISCIVVGIFALLGQLYMNAILWVILIFILWFALCGSILFTCIARNEWKENQKHED